MTHKSLHKDWRTFLERMQGYSDTPRHIYIRSDNSAHVQYTQVDKNMLAFLLQFYIESLDRTVKEHKDFQLVLVLALKRQKYIMFMLA